MAITQYIGSRYVPVFADPAEWNSKRTYEPLTIVLYGGNSYTSKQFVPEDIQINDEKYWAETGNYNAQIEQYIQSVKLYANGAQTFKTISELKTKNLKKDMYAIVIRYNTAWDEPILFKISDTNADYAIKLNNGTFALPVINKTVSPAFFGAYGDGIHDDSSALQAAFAYNADIYSYHTWYTATPLTYNNNYNIMQLNIKALNSNFSNPVLTINTNAEGKYFNIAIDASSNPIGLSTYSILNNFHVIVNNTTNSAVHHVQGYGNHFNISATNKNLSYASSTGLNMQGTDNVIDYIETHNIKHGVTNNNGWNHYIIVHPWIYNDDNLYINSIAFELYATCTIEMLYSDTMNIGIRYNGDIDAKITDFKTMFNNDGVSDSITNNYPPILINSKNNFKADATHYIHITNLYSYSYKKNIVNILYDTNYQPFMLQHLIIDNMINLSYNGTIRNSPYGKYTVKNISIFTDLNSSSLKQWDNYVMVSKQFASADYISANQGITTVTFYQINTQKIAYSIFSKELQWNIKINYNVKEIS